jgi:hypothetical protein
MRVNNPSGVTRAMRPRGMGDSSSTASTVGAVGSATSAAVTAALVAAHLTSAVPIVGPAIAAATIAVALIIKNSGCGQTCIETSQWANQASTALDQNISAYFGVPAPRTQSQQAAALANFDAIWARLAQLCGDPSTGNAGKRCISDRQAGACTWKALPPAWPGEPAAGACWNWFNAYRDPIANDTVVPDPVSSVEGAASSLASDISAALTGGATPAWFWPVAAAVALAVVL